MCVCVSVLGRLTSAPHYHWCAGVLIDVWELSQPPHLYRTITAMRAHPMLIPGQPLLCERLGLCVVSNTQTHRHTIHTFTHSISHCKRHCRGTRDIQLISLLTGGIVAELTDFDPLPVSDHAVVHTLWGAHRKGRAPDWTFSYVNLTAPQPVLAPLCFAGYRPLEMTASVAVFASDEDDNQLLLYSLEHTYAAITRVSSSPRPRSFSAHADAFYFNTSTDCTSAFCAVVLPASQPRTPLPLVPHSPPFVALRSWPVEPAWCTVGALSARGSYTLAPLVVPVQTIGGARSSPGDCPVLELRC